MIKIDNKYKLADMKMVRVDWLDAMSDDNTWQELGELAKQTLKPRHLCRLDFDRIQG